MTTVLVVALGDVRSPVLESVTLARTLGTPVVLSLQPLAEAALAALGEAGVEQALVADLGEARFASAVAGRAVASAAEVTGAAVVLLPTSFAAKEVAAHATYLLGAGLLIDVVTLVENAEAELVGASVSSPAHGRPGARSPRRSRSPRCVRTP